MTNLTHASSPEPPQPRQEAERNFRAQTSTAGPSYNVPIAVEQVVQTLSETKLRFLIQSQLCDNPNFVKTIENFFLVKGKDIIRYHEDTESEDCGESEESELEEFPSDVESENSNDKRERKRREKVILAEDEEVIPKNAICENCKEEFELDRNERGCCVWHLGRKVLNDAEDFWADHDPNCHGDPEIFIDDPDLAEGFLWTCCKKAGDADGCKKTKHKNKHNIVRARVPSPSPVRTSRKRKAERAVAMVNCATCHERYDGNNEEESEGCRFHLGYKKVSNKSEYAESFEWSCCGEVGDNPGCEFREHIPINRGKRQQ